MRLLHARHRDEPVRALSSERGQRATAESSARTLASNLCRCCNYRPIIDAALATCDGQPADRYETQAAQRREAIAALADGRDLFVGDESAFFAAPASEAALADLTARFPDAVLLGGATDVGLWITKQLRDPKRFIWLGRAAGFDAIRSDGDGVRFGATATLVQSTPPHLAALHPDLGELMRRFGSRQVRESGTVGGNIANASPIGDLAPALIALGASVELRKGGAQSRHLALEDFFIAYGKQDRAPGEYVSALVAPRLRANEAFRAFKVSKRFDEDISAVMGAFRFTLDRRRIAAARVAFGGMAATPKRGRETEAALAGVAARRDRALLAKRRSPRSPRISRRLPTCAPPPPIGPRSRRTWSPRRCSKSPALRARPASESSLLARPSRTIVIPAYEPREETAVVHKPHPHDSARLHVRGAATYVDDIREPQGTLHVAIGMADKASGRLRGLDLAAVRAAPGVVAVLTAADIPGKNDVAPVFADEPLFAGRRDPLSMASRCSPSSPARATPRAAPPVSGALTSRRRRPPSPSRTRSSPASGCCPTTPIRRGDVVRPELAAAPHRPRRRASASAARSISISKARSRSPSPAKPAR